MKFSTSFTHVSAKFEVGHFKIVVLQGTREKPFLLLIKPVSLVCGVLVTTAAVLA